jgi:ATP-dependent RNA helicase RhlE
MKFQDLPLLRSLLDAVEREGYEHPTPIQEQAIPPVLGGRDVIGCAQTGTGKTAAFALPILHHLTSNPVSNEQRRRIRCLVLTPTRELAAQVGESFETYGRNTRTRSVTIFGGVSQVPQEAALRKGPQILVATPGRLLDLMQQRIVSLEHVEIFVLDEADRMLDMGFIHDIRRVVATLPPKRQSLFFSATMPADIRALADTIVKDPVFVAVNPPASTVDLIEQRLCFVEKQEKPDLLAHFLEAPDAHRVLVFTRTKHGADKVVKRLKRSRVEAMAIHGNKSQGARTRALDAFKTGEARVLVATDIAARGIDVEAVSHVINFDLPNEAESYVHRIGRTGRAGETGIAIAFCAEDERPYLRDIERLIGKHIERLEDYPHRSHVPAPEPTDLNPQRAGSRRPQPQRQGGRPGGHPSERQGQRRGGRNRSRRGDSRRAPERSAAPQRG